MQNKGANLQTRQAKKEAELDKMQHAKEEGAFVKQQAKERADQLCRKPGNLFTVFKLLKIAQKNLIFHNKKEQNICNYMYS